MDEKRKQKQKKKKPITNLPILCVAAIILPIYYVSHNPINVSIFYITTIGFRIVS